MLRMDVGDNRDTQALDTQVQKGHQHLNSVTIAPEIHPKLHHQDHDVKTSMFLLRPCRVPG